MKKYYLIILLFYFSQCSLYDLSSNPQLETLFNLGQTLLISPNLESPIIADNIDLSLFFQNSQNIQSINISGADGFETNIIIPPQLNDFEFNHRLFISNANNYHTSQEFYTLKAIQINKNNHIIESNYNIHFKIRSVHLDSFTYPNTKPTGNTWSPNEVIEITPGLTGAGIKTITVTGTIVTNTFQSNISQAYDPLVINIRNDLNRDVPTGQVTVNIEITSKNDGKTNVGFVLN
ncbi:MAG: hypothetical protein ACRCWI_00205 [Brevinema sp.]